MDLKKAKILIDKINALHQSMDADVGHISSIEKDLMLSYVRQLYEVYLVDTPSDAKASPKVEIIKSTPKPKPIKKSTPVIKKQPEVSVDVEEQAAPTPPPPPKPARKAPRVVELSDELKELARQAPPRPAPTPTMPKTTPPPPPKPIVMDEEMEELFEFGNSKELSDKLSNLPIADLKKAMGLNEKIFTINELFGGDQGAFDMAIAHLNGAGNFENAKNYLIGEVAGKFGWTKRPNKKKAKNFIKLVRRRYS